MAKDVEKKVNDKAEEAKDATPKKTRKTRKKTEKKESKFHTPQIDWKDVGKKVLAGAAVAGSVAGAYLFGKKRGAKETDEYYQDNYDFSGSGDDASGNDAE